MILMPLNVKKEDVMADEMTDKQFSEWQAANREQLEQAAERARNAPAEEQFDMFSGEINEVVVGANQLTPEQRRSLAINMRMDTTRHAGTTQRSLDDAAAYTGGERDDHDGHAQEVCPSNLSYLSPPHANGKGGRSKDDTPTLAG